MRLYVGGSLVQKNRMLDSTLLFIIILQLLFQGHLNFHCVTGVSVRDKILIVRLTYETDAHSIRSWEEIDEKKKKDKSHKTKIVLIMSLLYYNVLAVSSSNALTNL